MMSSTAVAGSALMAALRTAVVFLPAFLLGLIVFPQHVGGCRQKFFNFNRLEHYADALVGRFIRGFLGGISRKQRSGNAGINLSRRRNHFKSRMLLFQRVIAQHHIKLLLLHGFNRGPGGAARHDFVSLPLKNKTVREQDGSFVVHHQHAVFLISTHNFTTGKSILKVVPRPTRLLTESLPAWFWMIPLTIHSPSPVPLSPLVVTNGSKMERIISGGIPEPVSAIMMRIQPWRSSCPGMWRVRMRNLPPLGMASLALITRLERTWRIWSAAITASGRGFNSVCSSTFARWSCRFSSSSVSSIMVFTLTGLTCSVLRYRPSICRTMRATRSVSDFNMLYTGAAFSGMA